jgi:hypothetical protein
MEILHEAEKPCPLVSTRLPETFHHTDFLSRVSNSVALYACMRKLSLLGRKPVSGEWCVGKEKEPNYSYKSCHGALAAGIISTPKSRGHIEILTQ